MTQEHSDDGRGRNGICRQEHYQERGALPDTLGFTVTFQYGTPTFYACLCRDEVALHLLRHTNQAPTGQRRRLCVRERCR